MCSCSIMASPVIFLYFLLHCFVFYSIFSFFFCVSVFFCFHLVSSLSVNEECEPISYPQPKTKITYYDSAHKIDKEHLYVHVAKPILQDFVISLEINENANDEDKKLLLSKKRYFLKVRGNWHEYPLKKLEDICLAFVHVTDDDQNNNSYNKHEKENEMQRNEHNICDGVFSSVDVYKTCYKENNFAIKNLFLYFEISIIYLKSLTYFYNIPVIINSKNDIIYLTNNYKNADKKKKVNLNLHICYRSSMEKDIYLGNVAFNAYPLNVEKRFTDYDFIYKHSFLTNNWNYNIIVNGKYLTSYNRLVFISAPKDVDTLTECGPFWDYAVLGAGPAYKSKKKDEENFLDHSLKYIFSNNISNENFIPFLKNDELKTENFYLLCLYSDENDYEGMAIRNIQFSINTTDSVVLILLIIFIIIFLPLIFSLSTFCVLIKLKFLGSGLNKLQLMNRKDEIEERLKAELNLDEYEMST